jgi:integrase
MLTPQEISDLSSEDMNSILSQYLSSQTGTTTIPKKSLGETEDEFLRRKINQGLARDTIEGYSLTFKYLNMIMDVDSDISNFHQDSIEKFIELLVNRKLKKSGMNRRIREIRSFVNDSKRRGIISHLLEIRQFRVNLDPVYINEKKMNEILVQMKPEHRGFILLYLSSGARLREMYQGELQSDNYLIIDSSLSKSRRTRELELSGDEVKTYRRLMACGLSAERLSRLFKIACVKAGYPEHHFHHIRHSMAVREINRSGKIYEISKRLGHSSVKVTESAYLRYSSRRIRKDFPSLFDAE